MKHNTNYSDTRPHYRLLDGLRGVLALMVVWYHTFEGFAFAGAVNGESDGIITTFNHGYLAVDFFFMMSGFVISYAYDGRWGNNQGDNSKPLTLGGFFKRRLIRLHPMVVMGAVIGAISFCIGGCTNWAGEKMSCYNIFLALIFGMLLIPAYPGARYDIRGNGEMFPLNGPSWSLFFEYIGNLLYALVLRRLSVRWFKAATALLGISFAYFAITNASGYGNIGVGWTLDYTNFWAGLIRMLFPFSLGILLQRSNLKINVAESRCKTSLIFITCSIILFALFSVPFLGADSSFSINGIYEISCIAIIFPTIIILAAGCEDANSSFAGKISGFLGDLSYPLYIVHYPVMYLFYKWLIESGHYTLSSCWQVVVTICLISIGLATLCLKLYDIPLRRYLSRL